MCVTISYDSTIHYEVHLSGSFTSAFLDTLVQKEDVGNNFALLYMITGSLVSRAFCTHYMVETKIRLHILLVPVVIALLCTQVVTKFLNFFDIHNPERLRKGIYCEYEGSLGPVSSSRPPCATNDT